METTHRIVVVGQDASMVQLVVMICEFTPQVQCVASSVFTSDAIELCQHFCPDVLVVEVNDYIPVDLLIQRVREVCSPVRVVLLDVTHDHYRLRNTGADIRLDYKQIQEVTQAIVNT